MVVVDAAWGERKREAKINKGKVCYFHASGRTVDARWSRKASPSRSARAREFAAARENENTRQTNSELEAVPPATGFLSSRRGRTREGGRIEWVKWGYVFNREITNNNSLGIDTKRNEKKKLNMQTYRCFWPFLLPFPARKVSISIVPRVSSSFNRRMETGTISATRWR